MIFVLWSVFEEIEKLPASVDACNQALEFHDTDVTHVFIDGKYPDYPGDHALSKDGTRGFCKDAGILLTGALEECEQRSKALRHIDRHAADGDYVLVLDADEHLTSLISLPQRVGIIDFERDRDGIHYHRCRLFAWEPGLHFKGRHYDLYDADENLVASLDTAPESQLVGFGTHYETWPRPQDKADYYRLLRDKEGHPADRWGVKN